jgi:starvation-inducible DNA-binding protein
MDELKQIMKVASANNFMLYMKAHNFHFNVEGPLFPQLHDILFKGIYEELYGAVDQYGEEIRALGSYAPMSLARFSDLSIIDEPQIPMAAMDMVQELGRDNQAMLEILSRAFETANAANEQGLADFIAGRLDSHKKHAWMLRATSKPG